MAEETLTGPGVLTDLKIDRVSYCWEGMNPLARIALYKRSTRSDSTVARKTATLRPSEGGNAQRESAQQGANDMPEPTIAELTKTIEGMKADIEKAQRVLKATKEEKEHAAGMDEKQTEAFWAKTPEQRKAAMEKARTDAAAEAEKIEKAKGADESLTVDGVTIMKSANPGMFAILKSQQASLEKQAADLRKAEERAELVALEKRASAEFRALPGTDAEKASILKHMKSAPEAVQASFESLMKAAQNHAAIAMTRLGKSTTTGDDTATTGDATARTLWKQKVQDVKKSHPDLSNDQVLDKAHDLYPEEFKAAYPETVAAVEKSAQAAKGVVAA